MKRLSRKTRVLAITAGVVIGIVIGGGLFTFVYAKGGSYMTNDPRACANCHIMQDHYDAWVKSSHRSVAACNDCHTPSGFIPKYYTKAENGFFHSLHFTTGRFPDPLRIKPHNYEIAEQACRKCHTPIVEAIETHGGHGGPDGKNDMSCIRCHRDVGHPLR